MIECTYGKKLPELILYLDGNQWIQFYNHKTGTANWRNRRSGTITATKPDAPSVRSSRKIVTLPTRPFIYSSDNGTWSNASFENGDEDYFEEISLNESPNDIFSSHDIMDDLRRSSGATCRSPSRSVDSRRMSYGGISNPSPGKEEISPKLSSDDLSVPGSPDPLLHGDKKLKHHAQMGAVFAKTTALKGSKTLVNSPDGRLRSASEADKAFSPVSRNQDSFYALQGGSSGDGSSTTVTTTNDHMTVTSPNGSSLPSYESRERNTDTSNNSSGIEYDERYDSYKKMLKFLPLDAVKHKMKMDCAFSEDEIETFIKDHENRKDSNHSGRNGSINGMMSPPTDVPFSSKPTRPPPTPENFHSSSSSGALKDDTFISPFSPGGLPSNNTSRSNSVTPHRVTFSFDTDPPSDKGEGGVSGGGLSVNIGKSTKPTNSSGVWSDDEEDSPTTRSLTDANESTAQIADGMDQPGGSSTADETTNTAETGNDDNVSRPETIPEEFNRRLNKMNIGGAQQIVRPSNLSGLDASQKNKEFFKMMKEKEVEEKRAKEREESSMDASSLRALKEAEAAAKAHDQSKSNHYSKLGSTFAIRGNILSHKTRTMANRPATVTEM